MELAKAKILFIGLNFFPEIVGIGKFTGELATHIAKGGSDVRVITAPPYYPEWRIKKGFSNWKYSFHEEESIKVFRCPTWIPKNPTGITRLIHLLSFSGSSMLVALMHAWWRPNVVFCVIPTLFSAPIALLTARISGAKTWLHIQDFEIDTALNLRILPSRGVFAGLAMSFERFVLSRFDRVSTISEAMLEMAKRKGARNETITLLPNWVDTRLIHPLRGPNRLRKELNITENKYIILYHGNMGKKQGLEVLIKAAKQLQHRKEILFLLCGEGSARADLERLTFEAPNIRFIGLQSKDKINQLVNLADIHVLPQRIGAADLVMPSKLTSMLASGKPVVVCAAPGTQLWKVVRQVGVVVPPERPEAVTSAIVKLMKNKELGRKLGKLGREYACQELDMESVLSRLSISLAELIVERG